MGRTTAPLKHGDSTVVSGPVARSNRERDVSDSAMRSEGRRSAKSHGAGQSMARPEATVAILQTPDLLERSQAWLNFVNSLSAEQFTGVINQLRGPQLGGGDAASSSQFFAAWAKHDPEKASEYAGLQDGECNAVFSTWLKQDAGAAMAWAEKRCAEGNQMWVSTIIQNMVEVDLARATRMLESFPANGARSNVLDSLVSQMLGQGQDAANAWLNTLTDPDLRAEAANHLTEKLAHQDPAVARTYLETLPAGDQRANAINGIIKDFTRKDPQMAFDLINSYSGEVSQELRGQFIMESIERNPELSMDQVEKITDEAARNTVYKHALSIWMLYNRPAATAWMANNVLPSGVREGVDQTLRDLQMGLGRNQ